MWGTRRWGPGTTYPRPSDMTTPQYEPEDEEELMEKVGIITGGASGTFF